MPNSATKKLENERKTLSWVENVKQTADKILEISFLNMELNIMKIEQNEELIDHNPCTSVMEQMIFWDTQKEED